MHRHSSPPHVAAVPLLVGLRHYRSIADTTKLGRQSIIMSITASESQARRWYIMLKRIIGRALLFWGLSSVAVFFTFPFTYITGCPRWLELPWSDFRDFVEGPDGRVYVSLGIYPSVLCYDRLGRFVASYPVPETKHGVNLGVDDDGKLYYWAGSVRVKKWDWQDIGEVPGESEQWLGHCQQWMLNESKQPICSPQPPGWKPGDPPGPVDRVLTRPATAGDVIFTNVGRKRVTFSCPDGSTLERHGNSIIRKSQNGSIVATYHTAWYLLWASMPFPLLLGWAALIIYGMLWVPRPKKECKL
jgi:hypothetical protein